ncbi:P-loop containing nucleoside triphosphate hydrolase protein [Rickenella mellea]|uniref:Signal recognition particle receptor subunit beta n=1 Tax=Rickenella mellea TaxID=50990 RepID=A0A4Y7QBT7_9AGAM|nr:P-loop containing nucleoside triphosphate hydrolase protein [Rickenella mellea]
MSSSSTTKVLVQSVTPEVLSVASPLPSKTVLIASFAVALLIIVVIAYVARRKSSAKGSAILLVGASDSGKTAILTTLVYNQTLQTHTSIQVNSAVLELPSTRRSLRIVDVPGHPRLRGEFKEYLGEAKAIAFVVDASTVARNGSAVAEHLHLVLHAIYSLPPTQTPPPLCILAHKTDLLTNTASTSTTTSSSQLAQSRVRTILERELEKRRASQAGGVGIEGLGAEGDGTEMGGLECRNAAGGFKFSEWEGGEIAFFGTSVPLEKSEKDEGLESDGLMPFREWLEDLS